MNGLNESSDVHLCVIYLYSGYERGHDRMRWKWHHNNKGGVTLQRALRVAVMPQAQSSIDLRKNLIEGNGPSVGLS